MDKKRIAIKNHLSESSHQVKIYLTDEARQSALENIWKQVDIIMSVPTGVLGYIEARNIVDNLNKLADAIYAEVEDRSRVRRYRDSAISC